MSWCCRISSPTHTHTELESMRIYKGMLRSDVLPKCKFAVSVLLLDRSRTVPTALEPTPRELRGS